MKALLIILLGCLIGGQAGAEAKVSRKPAQSIDCTASAKSVSQAIAKSLQGTSSAAISEGTKDGGENVQYSSQISYGTKSSAGEGVSFKIIMNYNFDGPPSAGCMLTSINTAN